MCLETFLKGCNWSGFTDRQQEVVPEWNALAPALILMLDQRTDSFVLSQVMSNNDLVSDTAEESEIWTYVVCMTIPSRTVLDTPYSLHWWFSRRCQSILKMSDLDIFFIELPSLQDMLLCQPCQWHRQIINITQRIESTAIGMKLEFNLCFPQVMHLCGKVCQSCKAPFASLSAARAQMHQ